MNPEEHAESFNERFARKYTDTMRHENAEDLRNRFTYHPPQPGQPELYERIRAAGLALALELNSYVPASHELVQALNHVDQAVMWANAAIARRS